MRDYQKCDWYAFSSQSGADWLIMSNPTISVLMGVYNGEKYLAQAINSIFMQTFTDFEFIIIDDGSTDRTSEILSSYHDPRLKIFHQDNMGLTKTLNKALGMAHGKYIARMDADDIAMPERFEKQVAFLDNRPEVGVLGTNGVFRDEIEKIETYPILLQTDLEIKQNLIKGNRFIHSSIMLRKSLLDKYGGYDERFTQAQDYALWIKLAPHTQFANLPDVLLIHREHRQTVSMRQRTGWKIFRSVRLRMWGRYLAFRNLDYPWHYAVYILQPIWFTVIETNPKTRKVLKTFLVLTTKGF
ncbi:MAG: hypothetical protein B6242_04515 [Anaerolineaceae bacterium 4572_78]|nr:MAG: hypothetical protein B6242_04515 [Anaerolineaceae bacterium 4572_78]